MAIGRRIVVASAVTGSALNAPFIRTARGNPIALRVSVDTAPGHARTLALADFLQKLQAASQGEIEPRLFDSAQLFSDRDVTKAMVLGQVDMAAPGTWLVAAYVPEADFGQLPAFYGQPAEITHRAIDGVPGDLVNQQVNKKLRVKVLGRWIDLGFINWYGARRLPALSDLKGLKIRNGGGIGLSWRARFFGGIPITIDWPDVKLALSQGTFDVLQTTNESCVSTKLWETGLRYALIDHQCMGNYIPMLSQTFWGALSPALKTLVTDLWTANIGAYRNNLAAAQTKAETELRHQGVKIAVVPPEELDEKQKLMMAEQDKAAHEMKISPELLMQVTLAVAAAP